MKMWKFEHKGNGIWANETYIVMEETEEKACEKLFNSEVLETYERKKELFNISEVSIGIVSIFDQKN